MDFFPSSRYGEHTTQGRSLVRLSLSCCRLYLSVSHCLGHPVRSSVRTLGFEVAHSHIVGQPLFAHTLELHVAHVTLFALSCAHTRTLFGPLAPQLARVYEELRASGKKFEIVFASSDSDNKSFTEYFGSMPWVAIPYGSATKENLSSKYSVRTASSMHVT
jgi:hypothetical protein